MSQKSGYVSMTLLCTLDFWNLETRIFEILKHEYLICEKCNLVFRYKIHYKNMSSDWAKNLGMCLWRYYVPLIFEILKHEYLKINLQKHEYLKINLQRSVISGWNMFCGILSYWRCTPCSHLSNTPSFITIGWELAEIYRNMRLETQAVFQRKWVCISDSYLLHITTMENLNGFHFDLYTYTC